MKGGYNMQSFMKNFLCSLCVFVSSTLFNLFIAVIYLIPYNATDLEDLSYELFCYIDEEVIAQIVFYCIFIAFQIVSLVLLFRAIGRGLAIKKADININTVSVISFVLMTVFSAIFVYVRFNGFGAVGLVVSNTFWIFPDLIFPFYGPIYYILTFVLYEIENAIKVLCVYKGYKKYIKTNNAQP